MDIVLSVLVLGLIVIALANEFFQQKMGVSPAPTMRRVRERILAQIPADAKNIVELGSGWGGIALHAARARPGAVVTGIEFSLFPYLVSRLRLKINSSVGDIKIIRRDFFDYPLNDADVVICYLTNPLMARLKQKFLRELSQKSIVISSTFFIPEWKPARAEKIKGMWDTEIFVYSRKDVEDV